MKIILQYRRFFLLHKINTAFGNYSVDILVFTVQMFSIYWVPTSVITWVQSASHLFGKSHKYLICDVSAIPPESLTNAVFITVK